MREPQFYTYAFTMTFSGLFTYAAPILFMDVLKW
jgi:hypothetical protein